MLWLRSDSNPTLNPTQHYLIQKSGTITLARIVGLRQGRTHFIKQFWSIRSSLVVRNLEQAEFYFASCGSNQRTENFLRTNGDDSGFSETWRTRHDSLTFEEKFAAMQIISGPLLATKVHLAAVLLVLSMLEAVEVASVDRKENKTYTRFSIQTVDCSCPLFSPQNPEVARYFPPKYLEVIEMSTRMGGLFSNVGMEDKLVFIIEDVRNNGASFTGLSTWSRSVAAAKGHFGTYLKKITPILRYSFDSQSPKASLELQHRHCLFQGGHHVLYLDNPVEEGRPLERRSQWGHRKARLPSLCWSTAFGLYSGIVHLCSSRMIAAGMDQPITYKYTPPLIKTSHIVEDEWKPLNARHFFSAFILSVSGCLIATCAFVIERMLLPTG